MPRIFHHSSLKMFIGAGPNNNLSQQMIAIGATIIFGKVNKANTNKYSLM